MFYAKQLIKIKKIIFIYLFLVIFGSYTIYSIKHINLNDFFEIKCHQNKYDLKTIQIHETKLIEISNLTTSALAAQSQAEKLTDSYLNNKVKESPLIFIGGYARSGTTLMRAILDVHPEVSCGPETKIIPTVTKFIRDFENDGRNIIDLSEAKLNLSTIDSALALFIYHIMDNHIKSAKHPCAKDPDILYYMEYMHRLFPKAKFIYMVRDGRAVAYSMVNRVEQMKTFYKMIDYLNTWDSFNRKNYKQCVDVGEEFCMLVRYEDLVLKTRETLVRVSKFLGIEYIDDFMRHQEFFGEKIAVSKSEWSTDQIKNPIYTSSINLWRSKIRDYDSSRVRSYRMLKTFGYDV